MTYDEHESCRKEIEFWRHLFEETVVIKEVIQQMEAGYVVLPVVRVDAFKDGLRVVVRR